MLITKIFLSVMLLCLLQVVALGNIMDRKVSQKGIDLIESHEGTMYKVYVCPGGIITGGVGHALSPEDRRTYTLGSPIEQDQIDWWLKEDLKKAEKIVNNWVTREINQNQFDALVSFVFNVGAEQFKRSTLL